MIDAPLANSFVGFHCQQCNGGWSGNLDSLRRHFDGGTYVCAACGTRTPVETAYYLAIGSAPFVNVHFVCNYIWIRNRVDVPFGKVYAVTLDKPLDSLHYVNATANAGFPVAVGIIDRSPAGFSLIAAAMADTPPSRSVPVNWMAAGWGGPQRPPFLDAIGRAFELLHQDPLRTPAMIRGGLLEAGIAYEMFAAWYLRELVWRDDYYSSKTKATEVLDMIREAGITHLTRVPIRIALRSIELYRVFEKRGLPVLGGLVTRDGIIQDIIAGIALRNSVAHRGLELPDVKAVESFVRAVYFLIEAVMWNVAWEQKPPHLDRHGDVA
jgi:hypothetical protein